jgi:hypothetical protein
MTLRALDVPARPRDELAAIALFFKGREHLGDRRRIARNTREVTGAGR